MDITEIRSEGLSRDLKVVIPASDLEAALTTRLQKMAVGVRIPGFRPGKAPLPLLKQRYAASVRGEILEAAINDGSRRALEEHKLRPVGKPEIAISDYKEGGDLSFTISLESFPDMPEFDLAGLELTRYVIAVDEARVESILQELAQRHERFHPLPQPRKAETGDLVVFDFVGRIDGKTFAGGEGKDERVVLGSGRYIKGYEEQMVGCTIGARFDINVTFPADYRERTLAGKDAVFALTIKDIQEAEDVAVDDRLAKEVGHRDLAALRQAIRESVERDFVSLSRSRLQRDLHDALLDLGDFDLPAQAVAAELSRLTSQQGQDPAEPDSVKPDSGEPDPPVAEGAVSKDGAAKDTPSQDEVRTAAERKVRLGLMLAEIGHRNDLSVGQRELSRVLEAQARRHPGQEAQFIQHARENPEILESMRAIAYEEKVVDFVLEMATVRDQAASLEAVIGTQSSASGDGEPGEAGAPAPVEDAVSAENTQAAASTRAVAQGES